MKKTLLAIFAIASLATVPVFAQTMMGGNGMVPGMMTERQQQVPSVPNQEHWQNMHTRGMYNSNGMMGGGYNMMGNYGAMPMMGGGYGMMSMMGGGYGMMGNCGMMPMMGGNYGMMGDMGMMYAQGTDNFEKYSTFVKETRDLRKNIHNLMFDYNEARWNPDTSVGDLTKMAEEIHKLRQDIKDKFPQ